MANQNQTNSGGQPTAPRRKKRRRRGGTVAHVFATIGKVIGTLLLVGVTTGALLACFAAVYIQTVIVPKADLNLGDFSMDMSLSSTMYYTDQSTGELRELASIYGAENRVWVSYDEIPRYLKDATVAIEDKRFWEHHGVDWIRTAKGVLNMFTGQDIQGGSTITQQLIKNLTNEDEVTVQRKILEIFRALEFEKKYKKEPILEWYLNYIYLGEHCNGVYTASYTYFGKDVSQLSLAECASLISITNNPSMFNPYATRSDNPTWGKDNNKRRALQTIYNMLEQGMISQQEYDQAKAELEAGLNYVRGEGEQREETVYTWYEDQVISDVVQDLMEQKDLSKKVATNMVYYGGLTIETCINPAVQEIVDSIYEDMENLPYTSSSGQQLQSAIVIVDPSGNIVALSGGMGEKESSRLWSRATDTARAPGSAFKPLSVYAPALDMGLITPGTVFDDSPYQMMNGSPYPSNSYLYYVGRMTVREGVYRSSNCVAIKALERLTPQASFDFLTSNMGLDLVRMNEAGGTDIALAPLSMGGLTDGVSVRDMATAYSVFPRGGTYLESRTYTRVLDSKGNVILDNTDRMPTQAVKDTTAYYINSMLQDVVNLGYSQYGATGYNAKFDGMTIAGKTGSTNSNRDRWFVGYSPYYTAAVWTGYDEQERIRTNGENPAAVMWRKVMSQVHEGLESTSFPKPDGLTEVVICRDSGMLANDSCRMDPRGSRVKSEYYFPGDAPTQYCTVHNQSAFPEGSLVTFCLDDPMLNANGEAMNSLFHIAGEFCPADRLSAVCLMDLDRERVGDNYTVRDDYYTVDYFRGLGDAAYCTLHTDAGEPEPYDPSTFDSLDPATWPTQEQWPGFDPLDALTWPNATQPPNGGETPEPGEPTQPSDTPEPGSSPEPSASTEPNGGDAPPPTPPPIDEPGTDIPPDEPFVPAA